jgi:hypothetical protein
VGACGGDREVDGEDGEFDVRVEKRVLAADADVALAVVKDRGTMEFVPPGESEQRQDCEFAGYVRVGIGGGRAQCTFARKWTQNCH